jgi:membrane protease YdiL (CAAX protease family)
VCLDAEAVRARRLTLRDGATFVIAFALGQRAAGRALALVGDGGPIAALGAQLGLALLVGLPAAAYLARRRATRPLMPYGWATAVALAVGALAATVARAQGFPPALFVAALRSQPQGALLAIPILIAEELLFRGIVQRGLEEALAARTTLPVVRARTLAAFASVLLSVVASASAGAPGPGILLALHGAAAVTRAITGRNSASILARLLAAAGAAAWAAAGA